MLVKTRGVVLRSIKYRETSLILKVYTEELGLRSYIVNGVRKSNSRQKSGLLQHLQLLDLQVYERAGKDLHRFKEFRPAHVFSSIPFSQQKSSIAMFLSEVLAKSIKEEEPNPPLFNFLFESIRFLDLTEDSCANFSLWFVLELSRYLGFYPKGEHDLTKDRFDLTAGHFVEDNRVNYGLMSKNSSTVLRSFLNRSFGDLWDYSMNGELRNEFLDDLMNYYGAHLAGWREMQSLAILRLVYS